MTDPTRLHESETNSLDARLLRAGREYAPPRARLRRIAGGIASVGATVGASTVAGASTAGLGLKVWGTGLVSVLKWLGIGALSGLTLSVTATVVHTPTEPDAVSEREHAAGESPRVPIATENASKPDKPAPVPAEAPPVDRRAVAAAAAPGRERASEPVVARGSAVIPRSAASKPQSEVVSSESTASTATAVEAALREEVAALGLAKAALDRGAADEVLALVSAYRVRFPRGHLGPEAAYLEMEGQLLRGNVERARQLAGELSSVASPNAKRVREVLQGGQGR